MSTRGLIAIMDEDGSSRSIYCHSDMYPPHAGVVLPAHYATREAVEALSPSSAVPSRNARRTVATGAMSSTSLRTGATAGFSPTRRSTASGAVYSYLFMDGEWLCSDGGSWTPVAELQE